MNEKGQSSLFLIILLMLFTIISLNQISLRIDKSKDQKELTRLLLCTKEINGKTTEFVKTIARSNKLIKLITIAKIGTYLIPGYNITSKLMAKNVVNTLIATQNTSLLNYYRFLINTYKDKCHFQLKLLKTPYQLKGIGFVRNKVNQTIWRNKVWKFETILGHYNIKNTYNLQTQRVFSKMTKVNTPLRQFYSHLF